MFEVSLGLLVVFALAVVAGSFVQATVGLGVGLVFAPLVVATEPHLMPALPLWLGVLTPAMSLVWERRDIDWNTVALLLPSRFVGTILGVWVVLQVDADQLAVVVATMVLLAVAISVRTVRIPDNPYTLVGVGAVAGVAGTATSIAGPPVALVMQNRPPKELRTTLAVFFCLGAAASLVGLAFGGRVPAESVGLAALLAPCVLLGVWLGSLVRPRIPRERFRHGVLAVCAASGVVLLVRAVL